jgi:hypothetical protein
MNHQDIKRMLKTLPIDFIIKCLEEREDIFRLKIITNKDIDKFQKYFSDQMVKFTGGLNG